MKTKTKKEIQYLGFAFLLCVYSIIPLSLIDYPNLEMTDQKRDLPKPSSDTINITSPENKSYTSPMSGYYPGTFGFENDDNGADPREWNIVSEYGNARIISELDGHKKVLGLQDTASGSGETVRLYNNFSAQDYGTIEVWIQQNSLSLDEHRGQITGMTDGSILFGVRMWGGSPRWRATDNGTIVDISGAPAPLVNMWYHIRIDFEHTIGGYEGLSQNEYYVSINGTRYGPYLFDNNNSLEEFHLHTYSWGALYDTYFDAVGYSWDPSYNIGDNLNEGLLLNFSPDDLDWMGYSLDGQINVTILGNTTILPSNGYHRIQVFGFNLMGAFYESDIKYFARKEWINLTTPEEISYTGPMSGYYPGTFGFENDDNGADPREWNIVSEYGNARVVSELDGHKKVLRLQDTSSGSGETVRLYNNFSAQDYGTVEVWMRQDDLSSTNELGQISGYNNDTEIFRFQLIGGGGRRWRTSDNGTVIDISGAPTPSINTWYHIRIDFEHTSGGYEGLSQNEYYVSIDGTRYGPYLFDTNYPLDRLHLHTYSWGVGYNVYFDAVSYSWDLNYNIGDNLFEGLLIGFSPDDLDWMGYSLDNQPIKTILGNSIFSMPDDDGSHTIQVFGVDSIGDLYESDIRHFNIDFPIKTFTPENRQYTGPMSGYYPGTFGFENDDNGADPREWNIVSEYGNARVVSELDGHKKVLRLQDTSSGSGETVRLYNNFSAQDYGTVEVWMRQDDLSSTNELGQISGYNNDTEIFRFQLIGGGGRRWRTSDNGTVIDISGAPTPSINTWYHIRIDFEHTSGGYQGLSQDSYFVSIDGTRYGPYLFDTNYPLDRLHLHTYSWGVGYNVYFDAVGYSWDLNYNIGDNLNEGLLISFTPDNFDWMGYSLDNQPISTILGNVTIPMPEEGIHSIVLFGKNLLGTMNQSETIFFSVDTILPSITITTPSQYEFFSNIAPDFELTLIESNKDSMWYTIDNGVTNITFTGLTGTIDQVEWDKLSHGPVNVRFYANDTFGNEGQTDLIINKDLNAPISAISFTPHSGTHNVNSSTTFSLSANDGSDSGVFRIRYRINDSAWTDYTGPFTLSEFSTGDYLISYYAIDNVGNLEEENTLLITLVEITIQKPLPDLTWVIIVSSIGGIGLAITITLIIIRKRK